MYIIAPIVIGFIINRVKHFDKKSEVNSKLKDAELIADFKKVAKTIKVNFDDCDLSHQEYEKEIILRKDTRYQQRVTIRFSECKIKFINLENNRPVQYKTPTLYMEIINLRYKLHQQKETTIYIDHSGNNRFVDENCKSYFSDDSMRPFYYFDVEFIGDSVKNRPKPE
jgi:hypothetical protein